MNSKTPLLMPLDPPGEDTTPVMGQYLSLKADHPEALLFFRMGDFYELFFDDAIKAAEALDITLTKRGKHRGDDIPMCGVPAHSYEMYVARAIKAGFKVAICEQTEDPQEARRKRGSKAVVERALVRVITPGTLTEDTLLDARKSNYLASLAIVRDDLGLAWVDVSTGDLGAQALGRADILPALARLSPGEIILPESLYQDPALRDLATNPVTLTPLAAPTFESETARKRLEETFGVASLDGFGAFTRPEIAALGALIDYVSLTQAGRRPRLSPPKRLERGEVLEIDPATRRNLELTETLSGTHKGSLLACIDKTITGPGARLLADWLASPLTDPEAINDRLDAVCLLVDAPLARADLRTVLSGCPDMARALSRLSLGRGGPRDLTTIRDALLRIPTLRVLLRDAFLPGAPPKELDRILADLGDHSNLADILTAALADEVPALSRDGGFIRDGYTPDLDTLRQLRDESQRLIAALQASYATETRIPGLKIRHNNVLGYFVEVPATKADILLKTRTEAPSDRSDLLPGGPESDRTIFTHRQTLANQVRFTTPELSGLEDKLRGAADRALALEQDIFKALSAAVFDRSVDIVTAGAALARLDVFQGLAHLAVTQGYCRPNIDRSLDFRVRGGRHPVVEAALKATGDSGFVGNDCDLGGDQRLWLLTGPNMAGKSTFLRQNALIVLLAQMGSLVPAAEVHLGVVDRLFSRVGAADDLARGRSTFMVEMVETAAILNQATERSLVILDEIGRGTATFDGLSIAWATVESLHDVTRCRALFATHYHELTALSGRLDHLSCHTLRVREWKNEVIFLHEVGKGTADRSYGIHVARLAGLPTAVLIRAEEVLATLESGENASPATRLADALPLFAPGATSSHRTAGGPDPIRPSAVEDALAGINPDDLSPREALEALYKLKAIGKDGHAKPV